MSLHLKGFHNGYFNDIYWRKVHIRENVLKTNFPHAIFTIFATRVVVCDPNFGRQFQTKLGLFYPLTKIFSFQWNKFAMQVLVHGHQRKTKIKRQKIWQDFVARWCPITRGLLISNKLCSFKHRLSRGAFPYIVLDLFDRYECYACRKNKMFLENQSQGVII